MHLQRVCIQSKEVMFWKMSRRGIKFSYRYDVENGHIYYLNSIDKENKKQAPKSESTCNNIHKIPWIPVKGPDTRKEPPKRGFKVIFTSAT